ncbi:MAG: hypothetical protein AAFO69_02825, partial [Bacteroidota bacterium]
QTGSVSFLDYYHSIEKLELPMVIECGFTTFPKHENEDGKYDEFIPENFRVVGRIESLDLKTYVILYAGIGDILYPFLYSYNHDGLLLASVDLHNGYCGSDPDFLAKSWTRINEKLTIEMRHTVCTFDFQDGERGYSRRLDSVLITTQKLKVGNGGELLTVAESQKIDDFPDTTIASNTVVVFQPSDEQIGKLKKKMGEDAFYTGADDTNYYLSNLYQLLDSLAIPWAATNKRKLLFRGNTEDFYDPIALDDESMFWSVQYFDGERSPTTLDLTDADSTIISTLKSQ